MDRQRARTSPRREAFAPAGGISMRWRDVSGESHADRMLELRRWMGIRGTAGNSSRLRSVPRHLASPGNWAVATAAQDALQVSRSANQDGFTRTASWRSPTWPTTSIPSTIGPPSQSSRRAESEPVRGGSQAAPTAYPLNPGNSSGTWPRKTRKPTSV